MSCIKAGETLRSATNLISGTCKGLETNFEERFSVQSLQSLVHSTRARVQFHRIIRQKVRSLSFASLQVRILKKVWNRARPTCKDMSEKTGNQTAVHRPGGGSRRDEESSFF